MKSKKQNVKLLFGKKTSWILLTLFFIFDNFVSYWAIKYMHGKEANLLIAPLLEKYPLLYFPVIPLTVFLMLIIVKVILLIAEIIFKKRINKHILERVILGATVLYWAVGNSSGNVVFLLGYRISDIWLRTTIVALPVTLTYIFYMIFQALKSRKVYHNIHGAKKI